MTSATLRAPTIISGAQNGVDMMALRVAHELGFKTGGTVPARKTAPFTSEIVKKFSLTRLSSDALPAQQLVARSKLNVDNADVTVAFYWKESPGTSKTIGYAHTHTWAVVIAPLKPSVQPHRPCAVIDLTQSNSMCCDTLIAFLRSHKPAVVNVCGHRESRNDGDFQKRAEAVLRIALAQVYGTAK
jgi:hypothetical protein